ncbi:MAG: MFS transporter, partial [Actinobacteria bacterium]|nr:MFS transporter [Actinomycetota bacterium]NIS31034.1 MFS transporter [Actinomycetota bacterium]NIT95446.1 MFS transporter [Actinomycetota bacterium]NIU19133.1 MFS transporter [Actinomycetota bacterium]NIU66204.1 MFS transporter [Actinomycetota bacterium]
MKLLKRPGIGVPMFGVMLAAVLVPLNSTMIAVALPEVADDLDVSTGTSGVLIVVYLVVMLVGQPLAGRVGDAVGARQVLVVGLVGMGVASLGGALAGSFAALISARTAQAVFAAMLVPSVQSIMRGATTEANRGRLFGLFGSLLGVGAALGPLVGGVLTSLAGWPGVFLVNLPVVVAALAMQRRPVEVVVPTAERAEGKGQLPTGSVFNRVFGGSYLAQGATTFGQYMLILVVPLVLDDRGWGADEIGLAVTALTAGMVVVGPIGGRLGDERGRRAPCMVGLVVAAASLWVLAGIGGDVAAAVLIVVLGTFGLGFGFAA